MKKFFTLALVISLFISICACDTSTKGGKSEIASSLSVSTETSSLESVNSVGEDSADNNFGQIKYSNIHKLLGYNVGYPDSCELAKAGLSYAFIYDNYSVIMGAPATSGDIVEIQELDEAVEPCKQYIFDTLEIRDKDLFFAGNTEQEIKEVKEYSNSNGIALIKIIGVFNNTFDSTEIPYAAYYLAYNSYPAYIVGIPLDGNAAGLEDFMDEMAKHIDR